MRLKILQWLHVSSLWVYRVATWSVIVVSLSFLAIVCVARYWLLPHVDDYRARIEQNLSAAAQQRITIGKLEGRWQGWHMVLALNDITVYTSDGQPGLHLDNLENTLSWWSLVFMEPRMHEIDIDHPVLDIKRNADGTLTVAGIHVRSSSNGQSGGGFANWLLRQDRIVIRDAQITWQDDVRGTPALTLRHVNFRLDNRHWWQHHHFGLQATPPATLASPIDVRGSLHGGNIADPQQWTGRLYAQLNYVDIEALRTWMPFSVVFPRGTGAARLWVNFEDGQVSSVTADTKLANVMARLNATLPALSLKTLSGRIAWQRLEDGFHVSTTQLALTTNATTTTEAQAQPDVAAQKTQTAASPMPASSVTQAGIAQPGVIVLPIDLDLEWHRGATPDLQRGSLRVNRIDITPLVALADYLPLDATLRAKLAAYAPRGNLAEVSLDWRGAWPYPERYKAHALFSNLGLSPVDAAPGFSGITGEISGDEDGGTLALNMRDATANAPRLFTAPIALNTLAAQASWEHDRNGWRVRFNNVDFANADLAGGFSGTLRMTDDGHRIADLTGHLTRGNPAHLGTYLPLTMHENSRDWLAQAFPVGAVRDARVRLKGDLAKFPFDKEAANDDSDNQFRAVIKLDGTTLHYSPHWQPIENMAGDVVFNGDDLEVSAHQGTMNGVAITQIRARIPHIFLPEHHVLTLTALAEGETQRVIDVIKESPVAHIVEGTAGMHLEGRGQLGLGLAIPFADVNKTQVNGNYHFIDNRVEFQSGPALEQINGTLEFNNQSIHVAGATFHVLGGPALLTADKLEGGGTQLIVQGHADLDQYLKENPAPSWRWLKRLSGATDWNATLLFHEGQSDLEIRSKLNGLVSALPAPFVKAAHEEMPLVFQRHILNAEQQRYELTFGDLVDARWLQQRLPNDGTNNADAGADGDDAWEITRGNIRLGDGDLPPDRGGVTVGGHIARFDLDDFLSIGHSKKDNEHIVLRNLNSVDLKVDEFDVFGRAFHDLTLGSRGVRRSDVLRVSVDGRELVGDLAWDPADTGHVYARLKQLTVPNATVEIADTTNADVKNAGSPTPATTAPKTARISSKATFPVIDVIADNVVFMNRQLGHLELTAQPSEADVRIDKFNVSNPDVTLAATGTWFDWRKPSAHTEATLKLDTNSIEHLFSRLGLSQSIKQGKAHLDGALRWDGAPYAFDYRQISGTLNLKAQKGQFAQIDPGAGKLLGLLSLQALPQRFSFDFRDIFRKGLAFEEITGNAAITNGVMHSDNLRIEGPAARINMNGNVNLAEETQQLNVKVYPTLSTATAIGVGLLAGPIAGVGALIAQKVLKNPIEALTAQEYDITGTWAKPEVEKVHHETPTAEPSGRPD